MTSTVFLLFLFFCETSLALVHDVAIIDDGRRLFKMETFGFVTGGTMSIQVVDFRLNKPNGDKKTLNRMSFIMKKSETESGAQQDIEEALEDGICILDRMGPDDMSLDVSSETTWHGSRTLKTVQAKADGLYSFIFSRILCRPTNVGGTVHGIHYLMGVLLFIKCVCLLVECIKLHYIAVTGSSEGWSIVYFLVTALRGIMLFTVILLIGSGWSLMKNHLNDKERNVILMVLSMQVFDNVAVIMLEECSPGSQWWLSWKDMLHLVDIMCCCAILFPIVWSIRHLRQAAEVDGKAQVNLHKLQLFRQFYVMVVAYIYFTRIVVFLLEATIPFYMLWLGPSFSELATFAFYVFTGYKFRPALDNPYLSIDCDERGLLADYGEVEHVTSAELQSHVHIEMFNL